MAKLTTFDPAELIRMTDRQPDLLERVGRVRDARLCGDDAGDEDDVLPDDEDGRGDEADQRYGDEPDDE